MHSYNDRRRFGGRGRGEAEPLRLLIAEDDPGYRAYIQILTRRLRFAVDAVEDGEAAIAQLACEVYDVVLIDLNMPRLSGLDVIAAIRADDATSELYALMLTGREDVDTKLTALRAGFDDFVAKSASEAELIAKLEAARRVAARQRKLDTTARELYGLATRDELTSVCNRRYFVVETERHLAAGQRLSVVLFDLDDFKGINDTYGHLAGDRVLQDVAALFQRNTRPEDLIARYGGDEFTMVISDGSADDAQCAADRLARDVRGLRWRSGDESFGVGVTTGIASSDMLADPSVALLLNAADRDLYKNKWLRDHPGETYAYPRAETARVDLVMPLPTAQPDAPPTTDVPVVPPPHEQGPRASR